MEKYDHLEGEKKMFYKICTESLKQVRTAHFFENLWLYKDPTFWIIKNEIMIKITYVAKKLHYNTI